MKKILSHTRNKTPLKSTKVSQTARETNTTDKKAKEPAAPYQRLPAELRYHIFDYLDTPKDRENMIKAGFFGARKGNLYRFAADIFDVGEVENWKEIVQKFRKNLPALKEKYGKHLLPPFDLYQGLYQKQLVGPTTYTLTRSITEKVFFYFHSEACYLRSLPQEEVSASHIRLLTTAAIVGNTQLCLWLLENEGFKDYWHVVHSLASATRNQDTVIALLRKIKDNWKFWKDSIKVETKLRETFKGKLSNFLTISLNQAINNKNEAVAKFLMEEWKIEPNLDDWITIFVHAYSPDYSDSNGYQASRKNNLWRQLIYKYIDEKKLKELGDTIIKYGVVMYTNPLLMLLFDLEKIEKLRESAQSIREVVLWNRSHGNDDEILLELILFSQDLEQISKLTGGRNIKKVLEKLIVPQITYPLTSISILLRAANSDSDIKEVVLNYLLQKETNKITDKQSQELLESAVANNYVTITQAFLEEYKNIDYSTAFKRANSVEIARLFIPYIITQAAIDGLMEASIIKDNWEIVSYLLTSGNIPQTRSNIQEIMEKAVSSKSIHIVEKLLKEERESFSNGNFQWEALLQGILYCTDAITEDTDEKNFCIQLIVCLLRSEAFTFNQSLFNEIFASGKAHLSNERVSQYLLKLLDQLIQYQQITISEVEIYLQQLLEAMKEIGNLKLITALFLEKDYSNLPLNQLPAEEIVIAALNISIQRQDFSREAPFQPIEVERFKKKHAYLDQACQLVKRYNIQDNSIISTLFELAFKLGRFDSIPLLVHQKQVNDTLSMEDKHAIEAHFNAQTGYVLGKTAKQWLEETFKHLSNVNQSRRVVLR